MHIQTVRIKNFRRLKDVRIDVEQATTIFVGANNSGKTSATHIFQKFLGKSAFSVYDFSADCWAEFNQAGQLPPDADSPSLPIISLDLWLEVDRPNLHRVKQLIPSLDWQDQPVGIRIAFAPKSVDLTLANFREAQALFGGKETTHKPWPQTLFEYLERRLRLEYEVQYGILDFTQANPETLDFEPTYEPASFAPGSEGGAKVIDSLVRVDFLEAQRHLTDGDGRESKGRAEDLSKKLNRYYARNLDQLESDLNALGALAEAEGRLNEHFASVFKETLASLKTLGYPGFANPDLIIKAAFKRDSMLSSNAAIHYALPVQRTDSDGASLTLPDHYNGLGYKNLILMALELLDFHHAWNAVAEDRPPVHLIFIEEPESHLHAQLQQIFIRQVRKILADSENCQTQLVVTTHSAHMIYELSFSPIRYFCRASRAEGVQYSDVRNLSRFDKTGPEESRNFLLQYLKLTHCDLFFADAALLVEGNVERLLVPLMIEQVAPELKSCHLTLLEVGGAFAHRFKELIKFLDIITLVVTDIDSVLPSLDQADDPAGQGDQDVAETDEDEGVGKARAACITTHPGALTSNRTLMDWLPGKKTIEELLELKDSEKVWGDARVRVTYQTRQPCSWRSDSEELAGRTLEEAFALQNLEWCQQDAQHALGLYIQRPVPKTFDDMHRRLYKRVKSFDKTQFALALMVADPKAWTTPQYIADGLRWLVEELREEGRGQFEVTPAAGVAG